MNILFIGGTGIISSASVWRAVEKGFHVTLLNRGQTDRSLPKGVEVIRGDISDETAVVSLLKGRTFDSVTDWIAFTPDQVERDIRLFEGKTGQYIFISSASAYQTPPVRLPVTESTPLRNPFWKYSRDKIACEDLLKKTYRSYGFPITIVRPSHTYDERTLPFHYRYTIVDRMRKGKKVIIHGDGTSLWTMTHHRDFARGFVGLLANPLTIGEAFHITSDEVLTWNQIYQMIAEAAGARLNAVHIPSDLLASYDPEYGPNLLGDKSHSMIFDNSKIKCVVPEFNCIIPFHWGAREILAWYNTHQEACLVDKNADRLMDTIIENYNHTRPK
ncbi:SDR family oxidoreductase [bacterium]|nr:SDR family oxidoreductase [bacterium]